MSFRRGFPAEISDRDGDSGGRPDGLRLWNRVLSVVEKSTRTAPRRRPPQRLRQVLQLAAPPEAITGTSTAVLTASVSARS